MSIDEIRTQKALALLEALETAERERTASTKKEELAKQLRAFALAVEQAPADALAKFGHLTPEFVAQILAEYAEAQRQHSAALAKKRQFGL